MGFIRSVCKEPVVTHRDAESSKEPHQDSSYSQGPMMSLVVNVSREQEQSDDGAQTQKQSVGPDDGSVFLRRIRSRSFLEVG